MALSSVNKIPLSGSAYGAPIAISATSIGSGTTIHQAAAVSGTGQCDDIVVYAANIDSSSHVLTLGIGGTTTSYQVEFTIASGACNLLLPGLPLQNGLILYGSADSANKINVFGYVLRAQ